MNTFFNVLQAINAVSALTPEVAALVAAIAGAFHKLPAEHQQAIATATAAALQAHMAVPASPVVNTSPFPQQFIPQQQ